MDTIEEKMDEYRRAATLDAAADLIFDLRQERPSGIGLVLDRAREDAEAAMLLLTACDPKDAEKVRELQWQIGRFQSLVGYVDEILEAGNAAKADITDEHALELIRLLNGGEYVPED